MKKIKYNELFSKKLKLLWMFLFFFCLITIVLSFYINLYVGVFSLFLYSIIGIVLYYSKNEIMTRVEKYTLSILEKMKEYEKDAFNFMPIGMITYNDKNEITWVNPYMERYLKKDAQHSSFILEELDSQLYSIIEQATSETVHKVEWNHHTFEVLVRKNEKVIYFFDITEYMYIEKKYMFEQPVFGYIFLDNFDELSQSMSDKQKASLNNFVTNQLTHWSSKYNFYLKRIEDDKFIALMTKNVFDRIESSKFSILDTIREFTAKQNFPVTLSMGFSYKDAEKDDPDYQMLAKLAQSNLDLALGRGGDQVVIKSIHEPVRFYGGNSNPTEKRTRVRSRMISQALQELIKSADQLIILSHQYPDMDAFGSAMGIRRIAKMNQKNAWIVVDKTQFSNDIQKLFNEIKKDDTLYHSFISEAEAMNIMTDQTLVVLVDVNKPSLCVSANIVEKSMQTVIIDHHRRAEEFPSRPSLVYIEPYASSASELISELFEYQPSNQEGIQRLEATALLGGIIVDTRNFTLRTGSRTFDAASYLKSCGADMILIQRLLKENIETYLLRSHLLSRIEFIDPQIAIVCGEEDVTYTGVIAAQTADMLLSMENVDASFVIIKRIDGRIGISARSLGNTNVQRLMEKLGGGGHLSNAATQLEGVTVEETLHLLKEVLNEM